MRLLFMSKKKCVCVPVFSFLLRACLRFWVLALAFVIALAALAVLALGTLAALDDLTALVTLVVLVVLVVLVTTVAEVADILQAVEVAEEVKEFAEVPAKVLAPFCACAWARVCREG